MDIKSILVHYGIEPDAIVEKITSGLLHSTWRARDKRGGYIVQQLHKVISRNTCQDAKYITDFVRARGVSVPEFMVGENGSQWFERGSELWRCMKELPGDCINQVSNPKQVFSAGTLLAQFHRAAKESPYSCCGSIPHFHDSPYIFDLFKKVANDPQNKKKRVAVEAEVSDILAFMPQEFLPNDLPLQIVHGDPKISNFLFKDGQAVSLLDFDTCLTHSPLVDIGDALRSWCNPKGEDTTETLFDQHVYDEAVRGYLSVAELTDVELSLVAQSGRLMTIEVASRFLRDYFEDSYFGWDKEQFTSRAEHNLLRARGQLHLYKQMRLAQL